MLAALEHALAHQGVHIVLRGAVSGKAQGLGHFAQGGSAAMLAHAIANVIEHATLVTGQALLVHTY